MLRGGFGIHDYEELILIRWPHADKSKKDLGQAETIKYIRHMLERCHPDNIPLVEKDLKKAMTGKGEMLFGIIAGITQGHEHIELMME